MSQSPQSNPNFILSVGTQVVALVEVRGTDGRPVHPGGAVGVIVQSPGDHLHSYRVRFLDGFEASLKRSQFNLLAHYKDEALGAAHGPLREFNLYDHVIYREFI